MPINIMCISTNLRSSCTVYWSSFLKSVEEPIGPECAVMSILVNNYTTSKSADQETFMPDCSSFSGLKFFFWL